MNELKLMMDGYRLTTAKILYHLPDHPSLLQSYLWQEYDHVPDYPVLYKFLDFWEKELDGKLHSVAVESCDVIMPNRLCNVDFEIIVDGVVGKDIN